jgi:hypothetical protein
MENLNTDLIKLSQEGIKNLNRSIMSNEIEEVMKSPTKKSPGLDGFIAKLHQTFQVD